MKNILINILVAALMVGVTAVASTAPQSSLAFTHVNVIDATGAPARPDMTVIVVGQRNVSD